MIAIRRIQRTLFRMQADREFARAILAGDARIVAATALSPAELELLQTADSSALEADPGGKRRTQILGNIASEFDLGLALLARRPAGRDVLDGFLSSSEFHAAIAHDGRLPLAFADYLRRVARDEGDPALTAIVELESSMAELRRSSAEPEAGGELAAGWVVLASKARLADLPAGTVLWSEALRTSLDAPSPELPASPPFDRAQREYALLCTSASALRTGPLALPDVRVERLEPPADELLRRAQTPLGPAERADFARRQGARPEDLETFLQGLIAEGLLVRGR